MTEVLFYPVATLAAWASAAALARPTVGRQVLASALILVACATRLQAIVFLPAMLTAVVVKALLDRRPRDVLRFWPAAVVLGGATVAWAVYRLGGGGPASELFAAYRAAGDVSYEGWEIARFTAWHLADAILFTGVVPAVALALLFARWRRLDEPVRAFLAVTASVGAWLVFQVGVFASRNVGHIAERDLLAVAPLLFLALAVWLGRDAPRPRLAAVLTALGVAAAVLYLPVERFVSPDQVADGFAIVPLIRLDDRYPSFAPELAVTGGALALLAAALVLPRRVLVAVPLAIAVLFAAASVSTSRLLAEDSAILRDATTGPDRTWLDDLGAEEVTFVWSGDLYTITPWSVRFWNDSVTDVVKLQDTFLEGPVPQPLAVPAADGRMLVDGEALDARFVVASSTVRFVGLELGDSGPLSLWRTEPPLRISHVISGITSDRRVGEHGTVVVYGCTGGALDFRLVADGDRFIELLQNGVVVTTDTIEDGEAWEGTLNAASAGGVCSFAVRTDGLVHAERFEYRRA
jgi:hypothetical protein